MEIVTFAHGITNEIKEKVCKLIKQWDADPKRISLALDAIEIGSEYHNPMVILYDDHVKISHVYGIAVYTDHGDIIVNSIVVEKDKQSYGRQLMQAIGRKAEFLGTSIFLQSVADAVGFYEKLGFKLKNERISLYGIRWDDLDVRILGEEFYETD